MGKNSLSKKNQTKPNQQSLLYYEQNNIDVFLLNKCGKFTKGMTNESQTRF